MTDQAATNTLYTPLPVPGSGFTGRGVAIDPEDAYSGINICHYVGDSNAHVASSRAALAGALQVNANEIVSARQRHTVNVAVVGPDTCAPDLDGVDALVTATRGLVIGVHTADCVPVVIRASLADCSPVVAAIHAGWRGAVAGIVPRTVQVLAKMGATSMQAAIGPAICVDCFEVGEEVATQFPAGFVMRRPEWPRPHVDLPAFVAAQLSSAGVTVHPWHPRLCTRCHSQALFSARALGIDSGRNFTFIKC